MKAIPALAFVAALFAFLLFPLRFEMAGSILFAAGLAIIVVSDYRRMSRPVRVPVGDPAIHSPREKFGLAA